MGLFSATVWVQVNESRPYLSGDYYGSVYTPTLTHLYVDKVLILIITDTIPNNFCVLRLPPTQDSKITVKHDTEVQILLFCTKPKYLRFNHSRTFKIIHMHLSHPVSFYIL